MKKFFIFIAACCLPMISLMGCEMEKNNMADNKIKVESEGAAEIVDIENADKDGEEEIPYPEAYQRKAIRFNGQDYIFMDKALYRIDTEQQEVKIIECEEAVGQKKDEYLYWAIWSAEHKVQLIRLDKDAQIFEIGELEEKYPPAGLDIYGGILYIRYKLGNVEGYHISSDGRIAKEASQEEMKLYDDENEAAIIRMNQPDDREKIQSFPYHIMEAGYTKEICGKEFLGRHVQDGETGKEEFIVRCGGEDTVLFTYYEDAFIDQEYVVYFSSAEKNKLSIFDMKQKESKDIYEFTDGNFEILALDNHRIYGIWKSIEQSKDFLAGISLSDLEMNSYLEVNDGIEYAVINDMIYYADPVSGHIMGLPVNDGR